MKVVAFWREQIPTDFQQKPGTKSRRIAGQIQITCGLLPLPEFIQSEQSVVVNGLWRLGCQQHPARARVGPNFPLTYQGADEPQASQPRANHDRGRDGDCSPPPAQTRTGPIKAYGSYLECLTAKRTCGQG